MGKRKSLSIMERVKGKKKICLLAGLLMLGGAFNLPDAWAEGPEPDYVEDSRSVFLVAKTIERNVLTADGGNYHITVAYEEDAGIPEDAELEARELTGQEYEAYYARMEDVMDPIVAARLFDITILSDGEEIHPAAPVTVDISQVGFEEVEEEGIVQAVHFAKDEIEVMEAETFSADGETVDEVCFEAEGFSVYGIVYTVDFHWEVDGKMYDFSLPGGGFVSLSDLVEVLGIASTQDFSAEVTGIREQGTLTQGDVEVSEETRKFVDGVEKAEFSKPELVSVSKADEETTVGAIKDNLGLECEYSAELTEEQIDEINAQTVYAGDWALISVQPFDSMESLTVTMKNGDVFEVRVTDAQVTNLTDLKSSVNYVIYTGSGNNCYVLKPDGTTVKVKESDIDDLDSSYRWRFSAAYNSGWQAFYNIRPVNSGTLGLELSWEGNPLVKEGNNNIQLFPQLGGGYRIGGYNNTYLHLDGETIKGSMSQSSVFKIDYTTRYTVRTANGSMGKVNGVASFTDKANTYGRNSKTITAEPESGYLFDHWELNGQRIGNGASIAADTLAMSEGSTLTAFFRINDNQLGDDGNPGRIVNKGVLDAWLNDLAKREFPLNREDTTKTAREYDYENRIYKVDITSKSNVSTFKAV